MSNVNMHWRLKNLKIKLADRDNVINSLKQTLTFKERWTGK
jgi:uncharacterized coiled-coil protein SlyX